MNDRIPRIAARARLQNDKVSGKPVLVAQESVLILNETGADILALVDGQRTVSTIAAELAAQYNAPLDTITSSVNGYLEKLVAMNLVNWKV